MTAIVDDGDSNNSNWRTEEWFRCPWCGKDCDEGFRTRLHLSFKNASLVLRCQSCGYQHTECDCHNASWSTRIKRRLPFSFQHLTHTQCSRRVHSAAFCPSCLGDNVYVELELITDSSLQEDEGFNTRFSVECNDCPAAHETVIGRS